MNVVIYYYSLTGNTKSFASRFEDEGFEVSPIEDVIIAEPFVLLAPTYNFGEIPIDVREFLEDFSEDLRGVVGFGNRNWGEKFANAGDLISEEYSVPLIQKVELRGTRQDFKIVIEELISWQ
ncbi:class Ib ribonucleoside-diphosphate reductase assembly flavoprotein NrdI [Oceanobacillus sojae]|uniref:class Ib ribonucleoside-diphosphate reductase assembly flavoprotein NrdI n=1 Tax=Oceanobacillus sojae TaxID=582851 RepID=UPI00364273B8